MTHDSRPTDSAHPAAPVDRAALMQPAALAGPEVEVRVSARRKKTAGAHWEGDRIVVVVPTHLRGSERDDMVEHLVKRLTRDRPHVHASDRQLEARAHELGRMYLSGVEPASIRWVTNQNRRWASCTIGTREIRVSARLRSVPSWVLDAVIIHELAHLIEPGHSPAFRELESRYPRQHDASVYLDAFALGLQLDSRGRWHHEGGGQGDPPDDGDCFRAADGGAV